MATDVSKSSRSQERSPAKFVMDTSASIRVAAIKSTNSERRTVMVFGAVAPIYVSRTPLKPINSKIPSTSQSTHASLRKLNCPVLMNHAAKIVTMLPTCAVTGISMLRSARSLWRFSARRARSRICSTLLTNGHSNGNGISRMFYAKRSCDLPKVAHK